MARQRIIRAAIMLGLALALLISTSVLSGNPAAAGTVDDEQRFLQLMNQTRAGQGLPPLAAHGELTAAARSWSSSMAANDQLAHTPNMTQGITANWTVLGENVGVHGVGDVDQLFQAFVASPSHYQNLIDPRFRYVGIGVVHTASGKLWTTHRFMAADAPPTTAAPTTATPTTATPTTATPTTATPTTARPSTTRATAPPTTKAAAPTPNAPPTTGRTTSEPATRPPVDQPTTGQATPESAPGDNPGDTPGENPDGGQAVAEDGPADPTELIQPDAATIEDVLIDLVTAGI